MLWVRAGPRCVQASSLAGALQGSAAARDNHISLEMASGSTAVVEKCSSCPCVLMLRTHPIPPGERRPVSELLAWLIIDRILGNALRWSKPSAPRSEQVTWIRVLGEGWGQGTMCLRGLQPHILVIGPSQALALGSFSSTTSSTQSNSARPSQHRQHPTSDQCSRAGREGLEIVEEQLPGRCWPVPPHHPQSSSCLYRNRTPLESPSSAKTASKVLGTPLSQPFPNRQLTPHPTQEPALPAWLLQRQPRHHCPSTCAGMDSPVCAEPRNTWTPRCCICFYPTVRSSPGAPGSHPQSSKAAAGLEYRCRGSLTEGSTVHPRGSPHPPNRALHLKTCTLATTPLSRTHPSPGRDAASRGGG